ncbi:hypothetical protein HU200_043879 [Digitaria exilis]|uniref:Reverse transcriptase zinc-binding domain-containing protein n=1 Tax=Digitaria exilis TaxID=1010633 RepID=A0A835EER6_9POAL|nr:hypothetical protein HU200_043879 [Digitaria exilis]
MTSFWHDLWCGTNSLAVTFPALYSHTTRPNACVARVLSDPALLLTLRPHLTNAATRELLELHALVSPALSTEESPDIRVLRHNGKVPTSKDHYILSFGSLMDDAFVQEIWHNHSPQNFKFFTWLLHRRRLSTNARLFYCNMRSDGNCPFCSESEDCFHLFLSCPRSKSFWSFLAMDLGSLLPANGMEQLWTVNPIQEHNQRIRATVLTCILWNIWKCRNAKVFRGEDEANGQIARRCFDDLLWSHRCNSPTDRDRIVEWSSFFIRE